MALCFLHCTSASEAEEPELRWYKGNLHTHSLWSDGDDFPDMIVRWYVNHDYHFLALTDHNVLAQGERWMSAKKIADRGGDLVIANYMEALGDDVEIRESKAGKKEVRLKTFDECQNQFNDAGSFLLLTGEEISDRVGGLPLHMNATNLKNVLEPTGGSTMQEAMRANLRAASLQATRLNREILVHLNHPNFGWAITAEDLAAVTEERFFEVFNGHPAVNQRGDKNHPSIDRFWDIANTIRTDKLGAPPLLGLATDDSHNYHGKQGARPGRGWVVVRSPELSADAILKAINAGEFYASSGIELEDFSFDSESGKLEIQIREEDGVQYTTRFIGTMKDYDSVSRPRTDEKGEAIKSTRTYSADVGKTFATVKGSSVEYALTGNELYVRAEITSSKKHPDPSLQDQFEKAWLQPVMWKK